MPGFHPSPQFAAARDQLRAGQWAQAEKSFVQLARQSPVDAVCWHLLGVAIAQQGRLAQAIDQVRRSVELNPDALDAWIDLARMLSAANRWPEMIDCFAAIARLRPEDPTAQCRLSIALLEQGRFAESEAAAREAVRLAPELADAHINLGAALHQQKRIEDAIIEYKIALSLDPRALSAMTNMTDALAQLYHLNEAEAIARTAIDMKADNPAAWNNLATVLYRTARYEEAIDAARKSISLDPASHSAHANLGISLLMLGRYEEGWREMEARVGEYRMSPTGRRIWDGSPLNGRAIALRAEQGFGDTIQFIRYAKLVRDERGGRVIVEVPPELKALIATADGVDEVVAWGEPPCNAVLEALVMSLPARFHTTLETIPSHVPYLHVDSNRVEKFRPFVSSTNVFKVGLVWGGNPLQLVDRLRSCPIEYLRPLLAIKDVEFYALQKGVVGERDAEKAKAMGIRSLGAACADFADLAAAASSMDLIITVCTGPCHLAGGLGLPTWTMLAHFADWRWLRDRTDSPWYPTMRLFRQPMAEDWPGVIRQVAAALADRVNSRQP